MKISTESAGAESGLSGLKGTELKAENLDGRRQSRGTLPVVGSEDTLGLRKTQNSCSRFVDRTETPGMMVCVENTPSCTVTPVLQRE